jgi:hypothetical protein
MLLLAPKRRSTSNQGYEAGRAVSNGFGFRDVRENVRKYMSGPQDFSKTVYEIHFRKQEV